MTIFDVKEQLTFYGAYHHNSTNIAIHEIFVPVLLWTSQVLSAWIPTFGLLPDVHIRLNDYMVFDVNATLVAMILYMVFYFLLEPTAALLYAPQMTLSLLTATAFTYTPHAFLIALALHVTSWIFQFFGHYRHEGRAPALFDNIAGAFLLAPFFVHLEILFKFGYNKELQKNLETSVQEELARIHSLESEKTSKKGM